MNILYQIFKQKVKYNREMKPMIVPVLFKNNVLLNYLQLYDERLQLLWIENKQNGEMIRQWNIHDLQCVVLLPVFWFIKISCFLTHEGSWHPLCQEYYIFPLVLFSLGGGDGACIYVFILLNLNKMHRIILGTYFPSAVYHRPRYMVSLWAWILVILMQ